MLLSFRLDKFEKFQKVLLKDFEFHLRKGLVSHSLNYKLACANIFAIHNPLKKEGQERAVLLEYGLVTALGMLQASFSVLLKDLQRREVAGLSLFADDADDSHKNPPDACWSWLPLIRLHLLWMANNIETWRFFFVDANTTAPEGAVRQVRNYFWKDFADFFNALGSAHPSVLGLSGAAPPKFWEDSYLEGFAPLVDVLKIPAATLSALDQLQAETMEQGMAAIVAENPARCEDILRLAKDLSSSVRTLLISLPTESNAIKHFSLLQNLGFISVDESSNQFAHQLLHRKISEADLVDERRAESAGDVDDDLKEDPELPSPDSGMQMRRVIELVESLDVQADPNIAELKGKQQQLLGLIEKEAQNTKDLFTRQEARPVELYPKFTNVIPDTNCLISGLDLVKAVLATKLFTIVVPLTVVNELDGLKKGPDGVREQASAAFEFLEAEFARKNFLLKVQTRKGSYLHNLSLRVEGSEGLPGIPMKHTNDDVILECCVLQQQRPMESRPTPNASAAVLLTDDRNLKVKALAKGVPVADSFDFERALKAMVQRLQGQ